VASLQKDISLQQFLVCSIVVLALLLAAADAQHVTRARLLLTEGPVVQKRARKQSTGHRPAGVQMEATLNAAKKHRGL
jgi:hypothetical protein